MKALLLALLLVAPSTLAMDYPINAENVLRLMNEYRAAEGLPPLREDPRLMRAAEDRMRHMEELGYWSHEAPDGMSPFIWMAARDYTYRTAGENLANGFETPQVLVESWLESPGHRANILGTQFEDVGIAIIEGSTTHPAAGKSVVVLFASNYSSMRATK